MASLLSYALTNLSDVKESLGIASSDLTWDNLIIRKINQATRAIEGYCGRRFKLSTYTQEIYNATDTDQLILKNYPLVGDVTLEVRDTLLNSDDWETVEASLAFADANSGVLGLNFHAIGHWGRYRVTYQGGYSTIPEDLAEACASLAAYYVLNSDAGEVGVMLKSEGQRQIKYDKGMLTFDKILQQLGVDDIINSYASLPIMTDR